MWPARMHARTHREGEGERERDKKRKRKRERDRQKASERVREACVSVKRDLYIWQKRPIEISISEQSKEPRTWCAEPGSTENTFYREHILQRTHSIENTFYREHIL